MAQFIYIGDDARDFPDLSFRVSPGDVVDLDDNPDPARFAKAGTKAAKAAAKADDTTHEES